MYDWCSTDGVKNINGLCQNPECCSEIEPHEVWDYGKYCSLECQIDGNIQRSEQILLDHLLKEGNMTLYEIFSK